MTETKDNLIAGTATHSPGQRFRAHALHFTRPTGNIIGAAVVVFPGGGYNILAVDLEGTEVCDWLNSSGVNLRSAQVSRAGDRPYPKSSAALQDAQRALGLVREHAAEWGIDPSRWRSGLFCRRTLAAASAPTSTSGSTIPSMRPTS